MLPASLQLSLQQLQPQLDKVSDFLESRIKADLSDLPPDLVIARTKRPESIFAKLQTGAYSHIEDLQDLVGLTVVVLYRHQIAEAMSAVANSGLLVIDQPNRAIAPADFKYREPKMFVKPPRDYLDRNPDVEAITAEVQFTTTLQHALDVTTHDFDYKGKTYSWDNFRLVAQLRGMLEMVDVMIDDIEGVSLQRTEPIEIPAEMVFGAEVLEQVASRFDPADLPRDRRRLADTVGGWATAAGLSPGDLGALIDRHPDLVNAQSIDPASAILGAILRERATELLDGYDGAFCVGSELESLCWEASAIADERRVTLT
ncbi:MAG: hypothetical protein VX494_02560 [Actinomycetota bacterium]|nr:hypothetical protein [Actinomycetota bacterium]